MSESKADFERLTVGQLRACCERRGLVSTGLKKVLVERLIKHGAKLESDVAEDKTNKDHAAVNTSDDVETSMEADVKPNLEAENLEPSKTVVDEQLEPMEDNDGSDEKNDGTGINEVEDGTGNNEVKDKPGDTENNGSTTTATKPVKASGKPPNLGRRKFQYGFMKLFSNKCVVVHPFKTELFDLETFRNCIEQTTSYSIKRSRQTGKQACLMEFKDIDESDRMWAELHRAVAASPTLADDVTVEHPEAYSDSIFWTHRMDTGVDWLLNMCYMKDWEVRDPVFKRLLLFENVPDDLTHPELVEEFPEAINIVPFTHDKETRGMVGVELMGEKEANEFIAKYKNHVLRGRKLRLDFYSERLYQFNRNKLNRNEPEEKFEPLSDDARLELVKDYQGLLLAKRQINNSYDYTGTEKLAKCQELSETQVPLSRHLYADTQRRLKANLEIPEPPEQRTPMVKNLVEYKLHGDKVSRVYAKPKEKTDKNDRKFDNFSRSFSRAQQKRLASDYSGKPPEKRIRSLFHGGGGGFKRFQDQVRMGWSNRGRGRGHMNRGGMGMGMVDRGGGGDVGWGGDEMMGGSGDMGWGGDEMMGGGGDMGWGGGDMGWGGGDMMGGANSMGMAMMGGMGGVFRSGGGRMGGGMSDVAATVKALSNKVQQLERMTGGDNGGGGGGGVGMYAPRYGRGGGRGGGWRGGRGRGGFY